MTRRRRSQSAEAGLGLQIFAGTRLAACGIAGSWFLFAGPALAQNLTIDFGEGTLLTERVLQLVALITVLSLAPSILVMVTSFTRIVVVLSLLRSAIGLQAAPPNAVMIGLALFLTAFVMTPTFQAAYDAGVQPLIAGEIEAPEAFQRAAVPLHAFMRQHVREEDVGLFLDLSDSPPPATPEELSLSVLVPAFMISELRRAFESDSCSICPSSSSISWSRRFSWRWA